MNCKCFTNYIAYDFIKSSQRPLYVLEACHVLEVKSMLLQYGFFLWIVLILLWVILWIIWIFSFARSQDSDLGLQILLFINVCDFVMLCSKFMLLLLFISSGRNQVSSLCVGLWGFFCCLLWFWPCAWTVLLVFSHFWVCLVISFAFKILKYYVGLELKVRWVSKCWILKNHVANSGV
jgi:hypothetical protein